MNSYKKPDLNAPRFRSKRHNLLNESFCKKIKDKGGVFKDLSNKEIKEVIKTFNGSII